MDAKLQEIAYDQVSNISGKIKSKTKKSDVFESIFRSLGKESKNKKDEISDQTFNIFENLGSKNSNIKKNLIKELSNIDELSNSSENQLLNLGQNVNLINIKSEQKKGEISKDQNLKNKVNTKNLEEVTLNADKFNGKSLQIVLDAIQTHLKEQFSLNKSNLEEITSNMNKSNNKTLQNILDAFQAYLKEQSSWSKSNLEEITSNINKSNSKSLQIVLDALQSHLKERISLNKSNLEETISNADKSNGKSLQFVLDTVKNIENKRSGLKQELYNKSSKIQENEKYNDHNNNLTNMIYLKDNTQNIETNIETKQENIYLSSNLQQSDNKTKEDIKTLDTKDNQSSLERSININTLIELKEGYESNSNNNQQKENTDNLPNRMLPNQSNFNFSYNQTNITANITQNILNMFINSKDIIINQNMISEIQDILEKSGFKNNNLVIKDKEKVIKIYKDEVKDLKNYGINIEV